MPRCCAIAVLPLLYPAFAWADPAVEEIMLRLAKNQDRAIEQRKQFVYSQTSRVRILKPGKRLLRDESREYEVLPGANGSERRLVRAWGTYRDKGEQVPFEYDSKRPSVETTEAGMAQSLHESSFGGRGDQRGLENELFPFTEDELPHYRFELEGREDFRGRQVYRIRFEPLEPNVLKSDEIRWKGEVLVDREEFQPVLISTNLGKFLPLWFRMFFGVNVRQAGYSVSYRRLEQDVWFPVSYGTEFSFKVLHFFRRAATVSLVSEGFRKTDVTSDVTFAEAQ